MLDFLARLLFPLLLIFKCLRYFLANGMPLGNWFGIPVKITGFWFLFVGAASITVSLGDGIVAGLCVAIIIAMIYFFVLLHEFGHSLVAKHLGYKVRDIRIWPLAGVAAISGDWHKHPRHEFWISIAGPLVNIVSAFFLWPLIYVQNYDVVKVAELLFGINVSLACFNLLMPVFPMDGGRILRSFLTQCCRGNYVLSTRIANWIGIAACVVAGPLLWSWGYYTAVVILPMIALAGHGEYVVMRRSVFIDKLESRISSLRERNDAIVSELDILTKRLSEDGEETQSIAEDIHKLDLERLDMEVELRYIGEILTDIERM